MAIALVAGQNATHDWSVGATGQSVVLTNNPTAGNLVIALVAIGNGSFPAGFAVKDANNNTYVATSKTPFKGANGQSSGIFYLANAPANALKTITATWTSGNSSGDIWALEFSGANTVAPFENDATAKPVSASTYTTPSYTSLTDGCLYVSAAGCNGTISGANGVWTAATEIPTSEGEGGEYFIQTTHGAQAVGYALSTNGTGSVIVAAFKAAETATPDASQSTDNPVTLPSVRDWQEFIIPAGQDSLPVGNRRVSLPVVPVPIGNPYWTYDLNPPAFPIVTKRTEVPYGPPPNPYWTFDLSPPAFPLVQRRTEVPLGSWSNPFWVDFLNPPGFPSVSIRDEVPLGPIINPFWVNYTLPFNYPVVVSTTPN